MYENFGGTFLKGITFATELINSPFQFYPQLALPVVGWIATRFDPQETLLGYLPFLLKPIIAWLQPCLLLGVIYLFVFSSIPKGWVDYCRKKFQ